MFNFRLLGLGEDAIEAHLAQDGQVLLVSVDGIWATVSNGFIDFPPKIEKEFPERRR